MVHEHRARKREFNAGCIFRNIMLYSTYAGCYGIKLRHFAAHSVSLLFDYKMQILCTATLFLFYIFYK